MNYGYEVKINQQCTVSESSEELYGDWSENWNNKAPHSITLNNDNPDVVTSIEFFDGEVAFLVWAEWSTGDSFGRAYGGEVEALGLFRDEIFAEKFKNYLEKLGEDDSYEFKSDDGQEFKNEHIGWAGYFDCLDEIHIDVVEVLNAKSNR